MKIAVKKYTVNLSIRSVVTAVANDAEIFAKKMMFGEEAVRVGDVVGYEDVEPSEELDRISQFFEKSNFERIFGVLAEDREKSFVARFESKKSSGKNGGKSGGKKPDQKADEETGDDNQSDTEE